MTNEDLHGAFRGYQHTEFKLKILEKYLPAWFSHLQWGHDTLVYIDCYAGMGIYPDGTEGSPIRALRIAKDCASRWNFKVWCIFNDSNPDAMRKLEAGIKTCGLSDHVRTFSVSGDAEDLVRIIHEDNVLRNLLGEDTPTFYFLDPFGLSIPMSMIKRIMSQDKTEILLTFMIKDIVRWGGTDAYARIMGRLFDYPNPRELIEAAPGRNHEEKALNAFLARLKDRAGIEYVLKYRVSHEDENRTLFYVVHGTNHFRGFRVMKDCMFNLGVPGAFEYLGPKHPSENQCLFNTFDSEVSHLKAYLMERYSGRTPLKSAMIQETYDKVPWIGKHYTKALKELEKDGLIEIHGKGIRGGMKPNCRIVFRRAT
jgi:three-Cys-motif partner protein